MRLFNAAGERMPFGIFKFCGCVWQRMDRDNVTGLAAQVSYYFSLALFPFLILVGAVVGTLPFTNAWQPILTWITQSLPGDARDVVFETLNNLTQGRNGFLSVGLLGTIWAASGGLMNLGSALNTIYHVNETRSYWHRLAMCVLTLFILAFLLLASFGLLSLGDRVDHWLSVYSPPGSLLVLLFPVARWIVSVLLLVLSINVMCHTLPNLKRPWRWVRPGMSTIAIGWLLATVGFNWYLRHVATYNRTYGVLGAFVVLMVWIYIAVVIALAGGEVDAELRELRNKSAQQMSSAAVPGAATRAS